MKIIVSSDVAAGLENGTGSGPSDTDDSYAVELISSHAGADVLAVVVTYGNNIQPAEVVAARQTFVETPGVWEGPVIPGATIPVSTPDDVTWTDAEGDAETLTELCINEGVSEMARLLNESEQPVTILAIGPATDIACLVLNYPDVIGNIEEMVFLAGRAPGEALAFDFAPDQIFTDFNVYKDLRAAEIVLEDSDIPLTFITFAVSSSTLYTEDQIDSLGDSECSERAQLLSAASADRVDDLTEILGMDVMDTFDINAAYYLANPEAFTCENAGFVFVECTEGTSGVYNGEDNACAGHGPDQPSDLNLESEQVWVDPSYLGTSRTVRSCVSYATLADRARFETGTIQVLCDGNEWTELPE